MKKKKKQSKPIDSHPVTERPPEPEYAETTPQSMAEGFMDYAKWITGNKYGPNTQSDYDLYQRFVEDWAKRTKTNLNIDLPSLPKLPIKPINENQHEIDYFGGMMSLAEYCKESAATLAGESKDNIENESPTLTEDQTEMLDYLCQEHPIVRIQSEIGAIFNHDKDRKTIKNMLNEMIEAGLVSRPKNKSKGYIITPAGQKFHAEHLT